MPGLEEVIPGLKDGSLTLGPIKVADLSEIVDENDNEVLEFDSNASAVNHIVVENSTTGVNPIIKTGGESDTGITFENDQSEEILIIDSIASAVNEITIKNAATGNNPIVAATGEADTGITFENDQGEEILILDAIASAVNEITISNAATGSKPAISTTGESDIGIDFKNSDSESMLILASGTTAVNEITITSAATGSSPSVVATGDDTNVDLTLSGKGTGNVLVGQATSASVQLVADQDLTDSNGNELLSFTATGSAVNELTVTNAATGNGPSIAVTGGDADVDVTLAGKGTGSVLLGQATSASVQLVADQSITDSNGNELVDFVATGSAVNQLSVTNAATGNAVIIGAAGGDTDIGITLKPKAALPITVDQDNDAKALVIDHESTTATALEVDGENTGGTMVDFQPTVLTTGTALDMGDADALTTGKGIVLASASINITSGELLDVDLASSGDGLAAKTGALVSVGSSRTETRTSGTTADDYDLLSLTRTNVTTGAGGTMTAAGSVLRVENVATQSAGTLTDTVKGIEVVMDVDGSGDGIFIDANSATGKALFIDSEATTAADGVVDLSFDVLTTGTGVSMAIDGLTTGTGLEIGNLGTDLTSGVLLNVDYTGSGSMADTTGNVAAFNASITDTDTSGTAAEDYDVVLISRTDVMNGAGGTLDADGALLKLESTATETAGTLTQDVSGIEAVLNSFSATDVYAIKLTSDNAGAGNAGGIDLSSYSAGEPSINFVDGNASSIDPSATAESGWINIAVGGVIKYVPYYAAS